MSGFFSKIKDKLFPKVDFDFDDSENYEESEIIDDVEVDVGDNRAVSAAKKKNLIIVVIALILSIVIYFTFFYEKEVKEELVKTKSFDNRIVKSSVSPFKIDVENSLSEEDLAILDKPAVPALPEMPKIEEEGNTQIQNLFDEDVFVEEAKPKIEKVDIAESDINNNGNNDNQGDVTTIKENAVAIKDKIAGREYKDPRYAPIIVVKGVPGQDLSGVGYENNLKILNKDSVVEIKDSENDIKPTFIRNRENVVGQGKIINAVLETAIDTGIEGSVRAIVTRDVYGESGSKVLISRGSRLYGAYSTTKIKGNNRISINWTRLLRSDGISIAINSTASDQFGRAGIEGIVDNRVGATISNTLLSSILGIAGVVATDKLTDGQTSTTTTDPQTGTSTVTQSAINQAVSNIANNITGSIQNATSGYFDTNVRVNVPQGTRITILVNQDIKVPTFER